jgi:hypothetical protein
VYSCVMLRNDGPRPATIPDACIWQNQYPLDTANCCNQRTLYQRNGQFLIVNYDCRLARVYFHVMSLRFLVAAAVLFWVAAFLCASDRNAPVPSPPKLSEMR